MPFAFKLDNDLVILHMYCVVDSFHYPMTTDYIVVAEGAMEFEIIKSVEHKHYNEVYWNVIYDFIMSLEDSYNIIVCTPTNLGMMNYPKKRGWKHEGRRNAMWLQLEKQFKRKGHGFKYVHHTFRQLEFSEKLNTHKRARLEKYRDLYRLSNPTQKKVEGEYLFSCNPSESHIEREYLFSYDLSQ